MSKGTCNCISNRALFLLSATVWPAVTIAWVLHQAGAIRSLPATCLASCWLLAPGWTAYAVTQLEQDARRRGVRDGRALEARIDASRSDMDVLDSTSTPGLGELRDHYLARARALDAIIEARLEAEQSAHPGALQIVPDHPDHRRAAGEH